VPPGGRARVASKTGRARWVGVTPILFEAVCELVAPEDRTPDRRVFQGFGGDRFRMAITRACTTAGVPAFSPHDLRHRRISLLHLAGVPWARIGEHVGQRNLAVTANTYSHVLADESELDYADVLERFLTGLLAQRPKTSASAVSSSCSSPELSRPTESPSLSGLTAVVCSTSTRVGDPCRSIVGRNERGGAAVEVGDTSTVESASSSSACTTTA
jgi:hypothetical protein